MSWFDERPWTALRPADAPTPGPAPPTTLDLLSAAVAEHAAEPALRYLGSTVTYAELDELTDGVAAYLKSEGFAPGERLGLYLQNVPQFVIALFGAWKAGGVVVPLNPMYRDELDHILTDSAATAIVCGDKEWAEHVGERARAAGVRIGITTSPLDLQVGDDPRLFAGRERVQTSCADLLEVARAKSGSPVAAPDLQPSTPALISYTSGTTGRSKGAVNTHHNLTSNASMSRRYTAAEAGPILALAPLFHITGMVAQVLTAVDHGVELVLAYRFQAAVMLEQMRTHRPVAMVGPSTAYTAMLAHPDCGRDAFESVQTAVSGGTPLPPALLAKVEEQTGLYLRNGYGLTETTAGAANVPLGLRAPYDAVSGTLAVGLPSAETVIRIVNDQRQDLGPREIGEIAIDGDNVVPEYWNRPDATKESIPDGRLYTGDIGFMDEDGWLYVVDRKKDMINASGFKVWPREVEDVLYSHSAVREAAVVGVPDTYRGETVAAYVSLSEGHTLTAEEVIDFCRDRLAAYKAPRQVTVLEELPKTESGKILRRSLRSVTDEPST
ncbi:AMP-binding protein [Demetria terragena]|uniref:AMP-binding protein n=1 Tax=Demetria terragena TaxID=63959 RepID=UPI0003A252B8|nr:AMP-binding protein [Demetria terragena]